MPESDSFFGSFHSVVSDIYVVSYDNKYNSKINMCFIQPAFDRRFSVQDSGTCSRQFSQFYLEQHLCSGIFSGAIPKVTCNIYSLLIFQTI